MIKDLKQKAIEAHQYSYGYRYLAKIVLEESGTRINKRTLLEFWNEAGLKERSRDEVVQQLIAECYEQCNGDIKMISNYINSRNKYMPYIGAIPRVLIRNIEAMGKKINPADLKANTDNGKFSAHDIKTEGRRISGKKRGEYLLCPVPESCRLRF